MGVPAVEVSVQPMIRLLTNLLDLPTFVILAITIRAHPFVAPRSMSMNVGQTIVGDGEVKDTGALGVLVVKLHYGEELSAQDSNGRSDPYVVL